MGRSGAETFLQVLASNFDVLAGPVVSLVYPLYASIRAIETKLPVDDQQWLTYWVLYSIITLFELTFAKLIECGAAYVYEHFVRPYLVTRQKSVNMWYVPRKKDVFSKPDDILTAAEKYIEENGPEAFEKMIHRANRETTSKSSHYSLYNDNYKSHYTLYDDNFRYEDDRY